MPCVMCDRKGSGFKSCDGGDISQYPSPIGYEAICIVDKISLAIIVFQISGKSYISNRIKVKNRFGDDRISSVHIKNYISNRIKGQGANKSRS